MWQDTLSVFWRQINSYLLPPNHPFEHELIIVKVTILIVQPSLTSIHWQLSLFHKKLKDTYKNCMSTANSVALDFIFSHSHYCCVCGKLYFSIRFSWCCIFRALMKDRTIFTNFSVFSIMLYLLKIIGASFAFPSKAS